MRINLTTPYSEKDQVKALGARWDVARKTWYIKDVEDITPFKRWIPELASWDEHKAAMKKADRRARNAKSSSSSVPKTGPAVLTSHCSCNVMPWEDCEHSISQAQEGNIPLKTGCVRLTREIIEKHKTAKGGFTRAQLQAIGVGWPLPRGWLQAAIGREISAENFRVFIRYGGLQDGLFDDL